MDIATLSSLSSPTAKPRELAPVVNRTNESNTPAAATARPDNSEALARESLDSAVASISSFVQNVQRSLNFSVDESSGEVVVKVTDRDSGEVIRQLPSEEALRLSEQLESLRSLMFETRA
jgi:flagellar protein FlaG